VIDDFFDDDGARDLPISVLVLFVAVPFALVLFITALPAICVVRALGKYLKK